MATILPYQDEPITSWAGFLECIANLQEDSLATGSKWIFRGESRLYPSTSTTLERAASSFGIPSPELPDIERRLMREFHRALHHYSDQVPSFHDQVELLSVMQHYGAPTRLQDWTYSPYVAAFFAVDTAEQECAIWALEWSKVEANKVYSLLEAKIAAALPAAPTDPDSDCFVQQPSQVPIEIPKVRQYLAVSHLFAHPEPRVLAVNPYRLNDRLRVQQGVFLMPGDIRSSLEGNLETAFQEGARRIRHTLLPSLDLRREFLFALHRMNINYATLFPGLEGFARALRLRLAIPDTLSSSGLTTH